MYREVKRMNGTLVIGVIMTIVLGFVIRGVKQYYRDLKDTRLGNDIFNENKR
jgi:hypothetical protein